MVAAAAAKSLQPCPTLLYIYVCVYIYIYKHTYIHTHTHMYTMEYNSALERKPILTHATIQMNLEETMLSEICQSQMIIAV